MDFVGGSRTPRVHLGGIKRENVSSEEVVSLARASRAARQLERRKHSAVLQIQKCWRGYWARSQFRQLLVKDWLSKYSTAASDPQYVPSSKLLTTEILPPILVAYAGRLDAAVAIDTINGIDEAALRGALTLCLRTWSKGTIESGCYASFQLLRLAKVCCSAGRCHRYDSLVKKAAGRCIFLLYRELSIAEPWPLIAAQQMSHKASRGSIQELLNTYIFAYMSSAARSPMDVVSYCLPIPNLSAQLNTQVVLQLTEPSFYGKLLEACMDSPPISVEVVLQNVTTLLAGQKVTTIQSGTGKQLEYFQPSKLTQDESIVRVYASTVVTHLRRLNLQLTGPSKRADEKRMQLEPFEQGTFASLLHMHLDFAQFIELYFLVIVAATEAHRRKIVSSLSLSQQAPELLKQLWHYLAHNIGVPLEVPVSATRGFEIPSMRSGMVGLQPGQAGALALFCEMHDMYLLLTDDLQFYEEQKPFTLAQQRAIACTINTLVFYAHFDKELLTRSADKNRITSDSSVYALLGDSAPRLLASLYERDERRQFCEPALWLEPYQVYSSSDEERKNALLVSGGVLRVLTLKSSQHAHNTPMGSPASLAGSLGTLLKHAPHCVPFEQRVSVLRGLMETDKRERNIHLAPVHGGPRPMRLRIRRTHIMEDAIAHLLNASTAGLKGPWSVEFISQHTGVAEAGVDQGGLNKEFIDSIAAAGFKDENRGLFCGTTKEGYLHPNPLSDKIPGALASIELMGIILGKALYEGLLVDAPLAPFFASSVIHSRPPHFDDLATADFEIHRSLARLRRLADTDPEQIDDLCLDFTVENESFGVHVTEELLPQGRRIPVTGANVHEYILLVAHWHMVRRLGPAAAAFASGLKKVVDPAWLSLFSGKELNELLGGTGGGAAIDIDELMTYTTYAGGYTSKSKTIMNFWKVCRSCDAETKAKILKFITASSRPPLGGFRQLKPPLTIYKVECGGGGGNFLAFLGGKDVDRLPSSSTCANMLKLPNYSTLKGLKEKLLYAVNSGAGFDLS